MNVSRIGAQGSSFRRQRNLLDLAKLHESVDRVLLQHGSSKQWFSNVLHYSLVLTVSGQYRPFPEIGSAVLQMMATNRDVMLSEEESQAQACVKINSSDL